MTALRYGLRGLGLALFVAVVFSVPFRISDFRASEFALIGEVAPGVRRPEGPFGDHYGYYSLQHDYPVFTATRHLLCWKSWTPPRMRRFRITISAFRSI